MKSYYATFYMKSGAEINEKVHCMNEEDIKKALEKIEKMTSKLQEFSNAYYWRYYVWIYACCCI